jgi:hypothetical protein
MGTNAPIRATAPWVPKALDPDCDSRMTNRLALCPLGDTIEST